MSILSNIDYDAAFQFKGCNLSTKYNGKKHKVYLRLVCDDLTLSDGLNLAKLCPSIVAIEYTGAESNETFMNLGTDNSLYVYKLYEHGNNITENDVKLILESTPVGVTPVIHLPDTFVDLHFIYKMCKSYPRVRFCGGNLFCVDGVRLGCIGVDILDKLDIKYTSDCYAIGNKMDVLECVDLNDLKLDISTKPEKAVKKKSPSKRSSSSSSSKKSSPSMSFADMLLKYKMTQ